MFYSGTSFGDKKSSLVTAWATLGSTASRTTRKKWSRTNNWRRPNTGQSSNFSLQSSSSPIQKVFFNPGNFRKFRFPEKTPKTKEAYLYRDMFSKHFGERNANSIRTVEWQDSIACSSATALKWDASFQNRSGR